MTARSPDQPETREPLSGLVERVTFHSAETGFCVLRVKVRGKRDPVTVLGNAAEIHAGEHVQARCTQWTAKLGDCPWFSYHVARS